MARRRRRSRRARNSRIRRSAPQGRHPIDLLSPNDPQSLGRYLRESRELKELTMDEVVRDLRIRRATLDAFEQGDFNVAGSPVQARGLLRNYARFLGLNEEKVLGFYEASRQGGAQSAKSKKRKTATSENRQVPVAPASITDTPPSLPRVTLAEQSEAKQGRQRRVFMTLLLLLVSGASLAVIGFVGLNLLGILEEPQPTAAPVVVDVSLMTPTATFTATWTPLPPTDTPMFDLGFAGAGVNVEANIVQRVWMRAWVDGALAFEGLAVPGEQVSLNGSNSVEINAGNAAALDVVFNGQQQDVFGTRGQPLNVVFDDSGVDSALGLAAQPTPTITPIPSFTPLPTATITPLPSATPLASATATATQTASATATLAATSTPSNTPTPIISPTATHTPTATDTPTATATLTQTFTATAIVPPRQTALPSATKPPP